MLLEELSLLMYDQDGVGLEGFRMASDFADSGEHFLFMKEEKMAFQHVDMAAQAAAAADPLPIDDDDGDGDGVCDDAATGDDMDDFIAEHGVLMEDEAADDGAPAAPVTYDDASFEKLKPSHAFLARMQGLPRPAFISRRPTRAELRLVAEIEKALATDGVRKNKTLNHTGGGAYMNAFLERWMIALTEMSQGKRADVGAGLLTQASYTAFMERFGKCLKAKESYAFIATDDKQMREDMRDPMRGDFKMRETGDGVQFARQDEPNAGAQPRAAVHKNPERARVAAMAPAATGEAAASPKMLARPLALLSSTTPYDPTAAGYSSEPRSKKTRAARTCSECGWPQSGAGVELSDHRRVGGAADHGKRAGATSQGSTWGPCRVEIGDWNPEMEPKKREKALQKRAEREQGAAGSGRV